VRKTSAYKRYKKLFLAAYFLFFTFLFLFTETSLAQEKVFISAIQTSGSKSTDDFIELYNNTCTDIDLQGWNIKRRTASGSESTIGTLKNTIPSKGYFLWKNISADNSSNPDYPTSSYSISDNYSLALFNAAGEQVDSLTWGNNLLPFSDTPYYPLNPMAFETILRNASDETSTKMNYSPKNSSIIEIENLSDCPTNEPDLDPILPDRKADQIEVYSNKLRLNEILPNPQNDETADEYIEIYNENNVPVDLEGWILKDSSKIRFIFPAGYAIGAEDYLIIHRSTFKFTLNNTGNENIYLLDPNEDVVSETTYENARSNASLSFDGSAWKWSQYLTPGKMNEFSESAHIKATGAREGYVGKPIEFSFDSDYDNFSKITWDFGDEKKSYLKNPTHTYLKKGSYQVSVSASGELEDVSDSFTLKINDYPREKVMIVGILPNPAGTDSDQEWIEVRNEGKDTVNLKGWKIATGQKILTNHPIKEDLEINPEDTVQLTREFSYFTLHNSSMKLELRYPDGKTADKASYSKDPIQDDEVYSKEDGKWTWITPEETEELTPEDHKETSLENIPEENTVELSAIEKIDVPEEQLEEMLSKENALAPAEAGKNFSKSPEWENKKKNKLLYLAYGLNVAEASAFPENEDISPQKNQSQRHWATQAGKNIFLQINYLFNKLLSWSNID